MRFMNNYIFIILFYFRCAQSLSSGYTCETSVTLTCPEATKLLILEVIYSSQCPTSNEENNGGAIYAPSHCLGYSRDRASRLCDGQKTCIIDHSLEQRPSFTIGKQANCEFKGQSINIEYSCVPEFYSSKLPRIDICSLQSLHGLTEGFIHTPNYPNGYPNSQTCSKTVPSPDANHRLKIFVLDFDIEGLSVLRFLGINRVNDWFQINNSGEKMYGTRPTFTLIFDDIIEASLMFKSDFANSKRPYQGFLLYFIVMPIRGTQPIAINTSPMTTIVSSSKSTANDINSADNFTLIDSSEAKLGALLSNTRTANNVALTFLVVLLSGILFVILCAFLLYKRRNDRRIRYLAHMFNSFFPGRTIPVTLNTTDHGDETTLNNTIQSKLDSSIMNNNEKLEKKNYYDDQLIQTPILHHININEKRQTLEKPIYISNLKTCPSPYSKARRHDNTKFDAKEQINPEKQSNSNIYSEDPLASAKPTDRRDNVSSLYECVDLQAPENQTQENVEEVIYDVINTTTDRILPEETDYDAVMYAVPKNNV